MMKKIFFLHILFFSNILFGQFDDLEWKSYTSMYQVNDMTAVGSELWVGTKGGVQHFYADSGLFSAWTNTEGLAYNDVTAIIGDGSGEGIWLGCRNGVIQHFNQETENWTWVQDFEGFSVKCLAITGDTLWVGLDIGVSLYLISKREVKKPTVIWANPTRSMNR